MIHRRHPVNVAIGLVVLVLLSLFTLLTTRSERAPMVNLIKNGGFEQGFRFLPECGMVGNAWGCFTNDDAAIYGAVADAWSPVVKEGRYSQLLSINIRQPGIPPNRVIGIYQTVSLVPGQAYTLQMYGIIRNGDNDPDPWRYRVEWGYTIGDDTNWRHVAQWHELPWNRYDAMTSPGPLNAFATQLTAPAARMTLFVRLRAKWGTWPRQVTLNLDNVALLGPPPERKAHSPKTPIPSSQSTPPATPSASEQGTGDAPIIAAAASGDCTGPNLLHNGDFEEGFEQGVVANGWSFFTNDQLASYSFHDTPNFSLGTNDLHGQFIGINTQGFQTSSPRRYAGIAQRMDNLRTGATYRLCMWGILKMGLPVPVNEKDEFRAEWALVPGADVDPETVETWTPIPWPLEDWEGKTVYSYTATLVAPSEQATLLIRLWKTSDAVDREGDLILRAVHLSPVTPKAPGFACTYTVQPGDTLGAIALAYHTTVAELARNNTLDNPNLIIVGQVLRVPCVQGKGQEP